MLNFSALQNKPQSNRNTLFTLPLVMKRNIDYICTMNYNIQGKMSTKTIRALIISLLVLSACTEKSAKYVIGVSQCSEDIWRDKLNGELKTGEYFNDGLEIRFASANDNDEKQIAQINKFIDDGVDLLIVAPNQQKTISPAIDKAYDRGIPVILFDRKTNSDKYTAFIGCDNYGIGKAMGTFIVHELKGKGNIVEIRGLDGSSPSIERHRGLVDAIKPYPNIHLVASEAGDWKEESAIKAMDKILKTERNIDFVFGQNDRMAWGAYISVKQHGITRPIKYAGIDGLATEGGGLELVRDGVLTASYLYPTQGDEVLALAMKILKKQPFKRDSLLSTTIVTKDNAELMLMEAKEGERQKRNLDLLHKQVDRYVSENNAQRLFAISLTIFLLLIVFAAVMIFRGYLLKTRLNGQLEKSNDELKRLNNEVMELTRSRLMFFTNISHELRTPLTLITDPVDQLCKDEDIKGKSRDLLNLVKRNTIALRQLVNEILDFSKIQSGKMTLQLSRIDLVEAIRKWTDDFMPTAERKGIRLHIRTDDFTPGAIIADEPKIARVVFNLLSNALKYTPAGGDILVTLQDMPDDKLCICVRDTGKGIPVEEQSKVFERFFQAKGASSGTGIGLAIVKSFTELHGGVADVRSIPGKGSEFLIVIPRTQEGEIEEEENRKKVPTHLNEPILQDTDGGGKSRRLTEKIIGENIDKPTILIIDDNNDIRSYEKSVLHDHYFVLEAADGAEGLQIARREIPDLVICDVMMPVMDGLDFCQSLKSDTATSHIPIIMLTAKNLEEHRIEGYEQGADSYITKPFSSGVLLARINNLLQSRIHLRNLFTGDKKEEENILMGRDKIFISQLREIIQQNLHDSNFNVESISQEIGLSRVQLYRKVKAMTGVSVVELIRKARLQKGRKLLETTDMSVSEVAYAVGYTAPSYFSKSFKEEYGMSPQDAHPG